MEIFQSYEYESVGSYFCLCYSCTKIVNTKKHRLSKK